MENRKHRDEKLDAGYEKFKAEALSNKYGTGKNELSSNT